MPRTAQGRNQTEDLSTQDHSAECRAAESMDRYPRCGPSRSPSMSHYSFFVLLTLKPMMPKEVNMVSTCNYPQKWKWITRNKRFWSFAKELKCSKPSVDTEARRWLWIGHSWEGNRFTGIVWMYLPMNCLAATVN